MKSLTLMLIVVLFFLFIPQILISQVPQLMNYQGRLTGSSGAPLDTVVELTFYLYQDQGGTVTLWTETQSSVTVSNGLFSVLLGAVNPISGSFFDGSARYLGVQIGGGPATSSPMPIVSAAYAMKAGHADTAAVALSGGGSLWSTQGANIYYNSGNVGVGTTNPASRVHVESPASYSYLGSNTAGVYGWHYLSNSNGYLAGPNVGAFGSGSLYGVWGSSSSGYGVYGDASSGGYAGYFNGRTKVAGNFTVEDTGRVGIHTASPGRELDVIGTVRATFFEGDGSGLINIPGGWSQTGTDIYRLSGNVGIGTSNLSGRLELAGAEDSDLLVFESGGADRFSITSHATGPDYLSIRSKFENPDSQIVVFTGNGRVGVGTDSPDASLNAISSNNTAVHAVSNNTLHYGIHGENTYNGYGVYGSSSNGGGVRGESTSGIGVTGNSTDSYGVIGSSVNDYGLYGTSTNGDGVGASNTSGGNHAFLGGTDYALRTDGDIYIESGAIRGNIGPNNGAPFPRPAYDSGWVLVPPDSTIILIHGVGGNSNNYFVDMQFNGVDGISNHRIGGDTYYLPPLGERKDWGMKYSQLTSNHIYITNYDTYGTIDSYVRIRIWVYM